ncbi:MAG: hypothetical protein ABIN01_17475 [Ferruginibacter sp.]
MRSNGFLLSFLLSYCILLFSPNKMLAQGTVSDTSFYQEALVNTMAVYHKAFGSQSALYNGSKYKQYPFKFTDGHQFFQSIVPAKGTIVYDGIKYDSVLMQYDEISDVVTIIGPVSWIQLLNGKVERFNLYNSNFVWLQKDSTSAGLDRTGFYNIVYNGRVSLLKKQVKTFREEIVMNSEIKRFADPKDHYYIQQDGKFYPIKNRKDLYRIFGERKKDVQRFVKANHLSFRNNREVMLTSATAYYDNLKK